MLNIGTEKGTAMNPVAHLVALLEQHNLFEDQRILARNEFLKKGGSTDTNVYCILSGTLHIFVDAEGNEKTIRFGYEGNLIAALDSFLSGQPSLLYIQALKRTEVKVISRSALLGFINSHESYLAIWLQIIESVVMQQMEREMDLLIDAPKIRYQRVLERSPRLFQEIPHKYIANYLRMSPETLSRIKKS